MGKKKSIITDDMERCFVCGYPYVEVHHVIYGSNHKLADKYKLLVPLCYEHHRGNGGVHGKNKELNASLKKLAQERFEAVYGANMRFVDVFGKSYL